MRLFFLKLVNFGNKKIYYFLIFLYIFLGFFVIVISNDFANFRFLVNKSSSMTPSFGPGSLILVKKTDEVKPGDIISFYTQIDGKEEIITHRLMKIGGNVYITKGDANQGIDPFVRPRLVIGRAVMIIPYFGYLYLIIKNHLGIIFFILLPAVFFTAIEITKIIKIVKNDYL